MDKSQIICDSRLTLKLRVNSSGNSCLATNKSLVIPAKAGIHAFLFCHAEPCPRADRESFQYPYPSNDVSVRKHLTVSSYPLTNRRGLVRAPRPPFLVAKKLAKKARAKLRLLVPGCQFCNRQNNSLHSDCHRQSFLPF